MWSPVWWTNGLNKPMSPSLEFLSFVKFIVAMLFLTAFFGRFSVFFCSLFRLRVQKFRTWCLLQM